MAEAALLCCELPYALACLLVSLTLWRAAPLNRQLAAAGEDNSARRKVLRGQLLLWCLDPLALLAAAALLPTWRCLAFYRDELRAIKGNGRGYDGSKLHIAAFRQLGRLLLDLPFVALVLLLVLLPWRLVLCVRELLQASSAPPRRRACAWHVLLGLLDLLVAPCALLLRLTCCAPGLPR